MRIRIRAELERIRLRSAALGYAGHGWDVLPGAYLNRRRFCCGTGCRTEACHPAGQGGADLSSRAAGVIGRWWSRRPYSVLLATGLAFDVIEVSVCPGAGIAGVAAGGPVAVTPAGHWMMLVRPGTPLRPELSGRTDVVLHGPGSWVPAPPTREPAGRVRWVVAPEDVAWKLPDPGQVQAALVDLLPGLRRSSSRGRLRAAA